MRLTGEYENVTMKIALKSSMINRPLSELIIQQLIIKLIPHWKALVQLSCLCISTMHPVVFGPKLTF